jgi:homoserine dehydrogenase
MCDRRVACSAAISYRLTPSCTGTWAVPVDPVYNSCQPPSFQPGATRILTFNLCLIGFGNVGQSLVRLLDRKTADLRDRYGIEYRITGVATRRLGWLVAREGFSANKLLSGDFSDAQKVSSLADWIANCRPDALFEASSLNAETGEPAITHIRAALEAGAHAISANKGPVVHAHRQLTELAASKGARFFHESTMMDGAPVFSLFRETLRAIELLGFRGVLNSTTNVILECLERGMSFDEAVREAQRLGVAETDPSDDIEGVDAAVKVVGLVNVLMDGNMKLADVTRTGIREITPEQLRAARESGEAWKLIASARRESGGEIVARVRPERIRPEDPMYAVPGTSLSIAFETDIFKELIVSERDPGPEATAYGMLCDFINAVRSRPSCPVQQPQ